MAGYEKENKVEIKEFEKKEEHKTICSFNMNGV